MSISKITSETIATSPTIFASGRKGYQIPGDTKLKSPAAYVRGELVKYNSSTGLYEALDDIDNLAGVLLNDYDASEETQFAVIHQYCDLDRDNLTCALVSPIPLGSYNYGVRIMEVNS